MLRMQVCSHLKIAAVMLVCASLGVAVHAKCADSLIHVYGKVSSQTASDLTIAVEICPNARRPLPVAAVSADGHFDLTANFYTFLFEDKKGEEYCHRTPETVTVIVRRKDKEVARISLDMDKDFTRVKMLNYELRKELMIQIPPF
jgi:hypothetical protein